MSKPAYYLCQCAAGRRLELLRSGVTVWPCQPSVCGCSCHQAAELLPFGGELLTLEQLRELAFRLSDAVYQFGASRLPLFVRLENMRDTAELLQGTDVAIRRKLP